MSGPTIEALEKVAAARETWREAWRAVVALGEDSLSARADAVEAALRAVEGEVRELLAALYRPGKKAP